MKVSDVNESNRDLEETSSRLADGLKSCRAVVDNYRALLTSDPTGEAPGEENLPPLDDSAPTAGVPDPIEG